MATQTLEHKPTDSALRSEDFNTMRNIFEVTWAIGPYQLVGRLAAAVEKDLNHS